MTKTEANRMRRLELEDAELRAQHLRHIEVYREQSLELIELRAKLEHIREIAAWTADTAGDTTAA
jgi:hypothetical protein